MALFLLLVNPSGSVIGRIYSFLKQGFTELITVLLFIECLLYISCMKRLLLFAVVLQLFSCTSDHTVDVLKHYKTKNVVIIVVDGPRYSETWGEPTLSNIPERAGLMPYAVRCANFYNNGSTFTNPGHLAITCGYYENVVNNGLDFPSNPGMLQYYTKKWKDSTKVALITSKDKLHVLSNCDHPKFKDLFKCYIDCGVHGDGTGGYREDSITFVNALYALDHFHPKLTVINFKEPDVRGHANDSLGYIAAIQKTDQYVKQIWLYLQNSANYNGNTTFIVTNDHGRHLSGWYDGFVSHGDGCFGCKHIEFFAISPDFKSNYVSSVSYEQIDIVATVDELLGGKTFFSQGNVMWDFFK